MQLQRCGCLDVGSQHQDGEQVEFLLTQTQQIGTSLRTKAMSSTFTDTPDLSRPASSGDLQRTGLAANDLYEGIAEHLFFSLGRRVESASSYDFYLALSYAVREWLERLPALQEAFALIEQGHFSGGERDLFRPLLDKLRGQDPFFVLADFDDYMQAQSRVDAVWLDRRRWTTMSLLNTARSGFFSSDRAIRDYASSIWNVHPLTPSMTSGAV
jgi:hypothetical protein